MDKADTSKPAEEQGVEEKIIDDSVICPFCSTDNRKDSNFCRGCAAPMALARQYAGLAFESSINRIPEYLLNRFGGSPSDLQHALKFATVMFADIRGSYKNIFEGRDAEVSESILLPLIDLMKTGVHRYDGLVAQNLGDGFMALFGAPIANEAHAVRATYAALEIHEAIEKYNEEAGADSEIDIKVRIGLHSGDVIVGTVRNDLTFDYRVTGIPTHLANRMEEIAAPGETRMTAETKNLAEGLITVDSLGDKTIRGVTKPVEIFSLVGRTFRTRFQAHTLRGLSPFVGREEHIKSLNNIYRAVERGDNKIAVVGGSAGVGKSRLCVEFINGLVPGEITVLEGSAFAYDWAPYAVLGALLRSFLKVSPSDTVKSIASKIVSKLKGLGLSKDCRYAFEHILNIDVARSAWSDLDPVQLRHRTYSALCEWLSKLSVVGPLVIFLDDLQWFDNESLAFLQHIIEEPPNSRIFLLLTHRPEFDNPWDGKANCQNIQLSSLSTEGSRELIAKLVGYSPSLQELRTTLADWTQGHPFFIEETVRSLVDDATLIGESGSYELSAPNPRIVLAPSIKNVVADRIDRLDGPLQNLLLVAAAIGAEIPGDDLMAIAGIEADEFDAQIKRLQDLGLMTLLQSTTVPVFGFKHAIVRDVAHKSLFGKDKRILNDRIFRVFENLYKDRIPEKVDSLASHAFDAELWDEAAKYYLFACRHAASRSANQEVVRALDGGLQALEKATDSEERTQAGIDLRLRGLASLLYLGDKERMFRLLTEAEKMARSINDEVRLGAVNSQLATALWVDAKHERALKAGELALKLARKHKKFGIEKAALSNIATVHHMYANFDEVIRIHRGLIADFSGKHERKRFGWPGIPSVFCRAFLGSALTFIGEFQDAVKVFEKGMQIADDVAHPYSQTVIREELAYCLLWMDQNEEALVLLQEAQEICNEYEMHTMYAAMSGRLAVGLSACGRADEAIEIASHAREQKTYVRAGRLALNYLLIGLGTAYARKGDLQKALEIAREAEEMTAAAGESTYLACTLALIGEIQVNIGALDEADSAYSKGISIAQQSNMRPLEAQCRQGVAEICVQQSRNSDAVQQLKSAIDIYGVIGLKSRREAAEKRLNAL